jgi:molybdopterin-guanine dinucleotide biosynthesis protein A
LSLPAHHGHLSACGFVLAGGQSSRMGTDKAVVELNGITLIARALATLRAASLEPAIAGARSDLGAYAPVVSDAESDLGPLSGVCAALSATSAGLAVFLPVDLPLLPPSLITYLLQHARITDAAITLASVNGFPQTFPAVVARRALPTLQAELLGGRRGCYLAFKAAAAQLGEQVNVLPVEFLVQAGQVVDPLNLPATRWFHNLNTPRDLIAAATHHSNQAL